MRQLYLLIFFICTIVSASAQNRGIPLTEIEDDLSRKTRDAVNGYMEKNKLTEKEYIDLNIAKCKHPSLRTTPLRNISGGSTIVKTDVGTVRFIYISKETDRLELYVYLFSVTPDGKYIDSLYGAGSAFNPFDYFSTEQQFFFDGEAFYIKDNKIILVRQESDAECFGEYEVPYIITKDLKFKKISQ